MFQRALSVYSEQSRGTSTFIIHRVDICIVLFFGHFVFDSAMVFQIVFGCARENAVRADEGLLARVNTQMSFKLVTVGKTFGAINTTEIFRPTFSACPFSSQHFRTQG